MWAHLFYICLLFHLTVSADDSVFTVQNGTAGEDIELQCLVPVRAVLVLEWKQSNKYLFFYRDGKNVKRYQDARFADRVQLQDPEMKSGNLGVILKNVTPEDSGSYTCKVLVQASGGERKPFTRIIQLSVSEKSPEEDSPVYQAMKVQYSDKGMTEDNTVNKECTKRIGCAKAVEENNDFTALAVGVGVGVSALVALAIFGIVLKKREQITLWRQKMKQPNHVSTPFDEKKPLEPEC